MGAEPYPPEHAADEAGEMLVKSEHDEDAEARRILASLLPQSAIDAVNQAVVTGFAWAPIRDKLRRKNVHPMLLLQLEAQWELASQEEEPETEEPK